MLQSVRRVIKKTLDTFISHLNPPEYQLLPDLEYCNRRTRKDFGSYEVVQPENVSPPRVCPDHIPLPAYCNTEDNLEGEPNVPTHPDIKDSYQIERMKESCKLARKVLDAAGNFAKVGVTTDKIDEFAHNLIIKHGAYPSALNYSGFPKSICTSVNNVVCHGIPDDRPLADGDIITIDVTVYLNGFHGDCAATYLIGNVDLKGRKLVENSKQLLMNAISICAPGIPVCSIGNYLQLAAIRCGNVIVDCCCGHGIGSYFHGPPVVYHNENESEDIMKPGMTFTIEPILGQGSREVFMLDDNWTIITEDDSRTSQFEHTVLITDTGVEILTQ